jgi:hypothetical protein
MFFRVKNAGSHAYVQLVENHWEDDRSKQRVLLTLGALEELRGSRSDRRPPGFGEPAFRDDSRSD